MSEIDRAIEKLEDETDVLKKASAIEEMVSELIFEGMPINEDSIDRYITRLKDNSKTWQEKLSVLQADKIACLK